MTIDAYTGATGEEDSYYDPIYDTTAPQWKKGIPRWGEDEARSVVSRSSGLRDQQLGAMGVLGDQTTGVTAAERIGAYQGGQALQKGAGAMSAGGDPASARAAMLGYGQAGSTIGGKTMAGAADERRGALQNYSTGATQAAAGQQALEREKLAYSQLATQDKWNTMDADVRYRHAQEKARASRAYAAGLISDSDYQRTLSLIDAGGTALGAAGNALSAYKKEA